MALYCIADTHLSLSVPKPMDVFGSRWRSYTEKLVKGWNSVVSENDTVVIPGDISWGMTLNEAAEDLKLLDSLNGTKIISKGNHDFWWQSRQKIENLFVSSGINTIKLLHNNSYLCEDKIICGSRGWFCDPKASPENTDSVKISAREVIRTEMSIRAALELRGGRDLELIAFFHFPPVYKNFICRGIVELLHRYGIRRCYYGHVHGNYDMPQTICCENINMTLISADYLKFIPYRIV